jgi:hypothetical protein
MRPAACRARISAGGPAAARTPEKSTFASTKTLGGASSLAIALAGELSANAAAVFLELLFGYPRLSENTVQFRKGVKRAFSSGRDDQGAIAQFESNGIADIQTELLADVCWKGDLASVADCHTFDV